MEPVAPPVVEQSPRGLLPVLSLRELLAIVLIVILADVSIYWGQGYTGLAAFLSGSLLAFCIAKYPPKHAIGSNIVLALMIFAMSARLMWYGSALRSFMGIVTLLAFAAAAQGIVPHVISVISLISQAFFAGIAALFGTLIEQRRSLRAKRNVLGIPVSLNLILPLIVCIGFTTVFVLANPDAVTFLGEQWKALRVWSDWFIRTVLRPTEVLFWIAVAWVSAGLLKPFLPFPKFQATAASRAPAESMLFTACRNTLVMVNVLFVGYLCIEFITLWTRKIPEGFYYAGYAHAGAAWLTVALAMATALLSLIFSGTMLRDPRQGQLRMLANLWSVQNFLLALSVYNRLFIYINFNGLTQMRIVGLFGVSLVVVGFLLVLWKIASGRTFAWLVQQQLWALVLAVWVYAMVPVDGMAASYNVRKIQQNDLAACMQIGVQPLDLEGVLAILPLLDSPVVEIREGVAAIVVEWQEELGKRHNSITHRHWTTQQAAEEHALREFERVRDKIPANMGAAERWRFYDFAYKYY